VLEFARIVTGRLGKFNKGRLVPRIKFETIKPMRRKNAGRVLENSARKSQSSQAMKTRRETLIVSARNSVSLRGIFLLRTPE
jgi:hypothetical protein